MSSVHKQLEGLIQKHLSPSLLEIKNESEKHKGHENGPTQKNGETHFRIKIVSGAFIGLSRVERHRLVYDILGDLLKNQVHALSLTLLDNAEN